MYYSLFVYLISCSLFLLLMKLPKSLFLLLKGLQWVQVSDCEEAFRLFKLGQKHRTLASTKLNACSSRRWETLSEVGYKMVWGRGISENTACGFCRAEGFKKA